MRALGYEKRSSIHAGYHPRDPALVQYFSGGAMSMAGTVVNETTALNYSAVYRAVALIAGSVSTLPLHVYERVDDNERRKLSDHPLDSLLNKEPNPEMDAATFRETLQGHALTWGNGYAEIQRDGGGNAVALWPITPDRVSVRRMNGAIVYEVQSRGRSTTIDRVNVLHLPGMGYDGLVGYSPVRLAQQAIGMGLATETFGASLFGNGTHLGGILTRPLGAPKMSEETKANLKAAFNELHQGPDKAHRVAVLEEGMTWQQTGIPPEQSQFLQTRKFQVTEIARWYGIPPHMLYDLERSTNNNIEHQGIEFLTYCLRYWLKKWERVCERALLTTSEKDRFYLEHTTDDLVRADIQGRYQAYRTGREGGWLSINDIRRKENMNPIGAGGDDHLMPLNMAKVSEKQPAALAV
jgi:HK97 family phage portal protein